MSEKKTKTGTTTKEERELLEKAGKIILRELSTGQEVFVRGFGRFNVGHVKVNLAGPGATSEKWATIGTARFKPYDALKKAVREVKGGAVATPVTTATRPKPEPTPVHEVNEKLVQREIEERKAETPVEVPEPKEETVTKAAPPPPKPKPQPVSKIDWG